VAALFFSWEILSKLELTFADSKAKLFNYVVTYLLRSKLGPDSLVCPLPFQHPGTATAKRGKELNIVPTTGNESVPKIITNNTVTLRF